MLNLRDKEIAMLGKLISIGDANALDDKFLNYWKVLIYDEDCRDIISPLMNVGALRQKGVTLHLMLHSEREAVADAPAIYFIRPNSANLKRVVSDCQKKLYRTVHLHFLTRIDRPLLEQFAQDLVTANAAGCIAKLFDEYMDFVAVEPGMFTLNIPNSYAAYNAPAIQEETIKSYMDRMTMGLLSAIRVYGAIPVIRAAPGGAAEMLAQQVYSALGDHLSPRSTAYSLFSDCLVSSAAENTGSASGTISNRPLLLIFDRNCDLSQPLLHNSIYQALMDDLLDHRLNRVNIDIKGKDGVAKKRAYDVNTSTDPFFAKYGGSLFPDAVEANDVELVEVQTREQDIRSRSMNSSEADFEAMTISTSSDILSKDIESLPAILNRKANLEAHTNILQGIMTEVAARAIPTYFELESAMTTPTWGRTEEKTAVLELLRDSTKGTCKDKARLLLLATIVITNNGGFGNEYKNINAKYALSNEFEEAFITGCSDNPSSSDDIIGKTLAACVFVRKLSVLSTQMIRQSSGDAGSASTFSSLFTSASSHATNLLAKATTYFTKFSLSHVTKVVEALAEGRAGADNDMYSILDVKAKLNGAVSSQINKSTKFPNVMVFIIGGGCYSEYFNLNELLKHKLAAAGGGSNLTPVLNTSACFPRTIVYGCSEIVNGEGFLDQLHGLEKIPLVPSGAPTSNSPKK